MDTNEIKRMYQTLYVEHGPVAQATGYVNDISARLRYQVALEGLTRFSFRWRDMLDVGCGLGGLVEYMQGNASWRWESLTQYHGIDVVPEFVDMARVKYGDSKTFFTEINLENLGLNVVKGEYDLVVGLGVLSWNDHPFLMVNHMWERVRPGGMLVVNWNQTTVKGMPGIEVVLGGRSDRWMVRHDYMDEDTMLFVQKSKGAR